MRAIGVLEAASRVSEASEVLELDMSTDSARLTPGGGLVRSSGSESSTTVRIIRNGRIGVASVSGGGGPPELMDKAISVSRVGPAAAIAFPGPSEPGTLEISHPLVASAGLEDLTALLVGIEEELASRWPSSTVRGAVSRRTTEVFLANSSGFQGSYSKSVLEVALVFTFAGPDGLTVRNCRFVTGLPLTDPARIIEGLMPCPQGTRKVAPPDRSVPAVLSPRVLSTLLQSLRSQAAGWTRDGGFSAIQPGMEVASSAFTLHDRPRLPFGGASAPFDGEGVPTRDRCLVDGGRFAGHIHDLASASACGAATTGSAGRNPGELPVPVCTNLSLEPGVNAFGELLAEAGRGILVSELLPGGYGSTSEGDFRIPLAAAFAISGGQVAAPVGDGCFLAGNASEILGRIVAVEDTLYGVESDRLPHVLVDGLAFS